MLEERVFELIKRENLIEEKDKVVLGVSGGPDSIAMFFCLYKLSKTLGFEIFVAHINHGIREEATDDEQYVENWCQKFCVPFFVLHSKVEELAKQQKLGVEETGRKVRYDFFDEVCGKVGANKIAIAHNKNDNAETVIMNILRGSGSKGLGGIKAKQGKYIRPLIECSRDEIEEYCEQEKLEPRIDKTNFENEYTRNKIRNIVIPYIQEEFNPNIVNGLARLSEIMQEQEEYIQGEAEKQYKNIVIEEIKSGENEYNSIMLDLKKFNSLPKLIEKKIILEAVQKLFGTTKKIEKVHLEDILKLCNNNIGNKYLTPNQNLKIVIKNKQIHINKVK
ncbi:MAG: tRNA lysidine(34) synthetase TilS [Clostridia bacterium]|nr:tRNA lysidine(34) synthetase TilS [Clostridia bacterium]